jgi:hypothetical protein
MPNLRPEWVARLQGAAAARSSHAALVASAKGRVGHRALGGHETTSQRAATTHARAESIRERLGKRPAPGA